MALERPCPLFPFRCSDKGLGAEKKPKLHETDAVVRRTAGSRKVAFTGNSSAVPPGALVSEELRKTVVFVIESIVRQPHNGQHGVF